MGRRFSLRVTLPDVGVDQVQQCGDETLRKAAAFAEYLRVAADAKGKVRLSVYRKTRAVEGGKNDALVFLGSDQAGRKRDCFPLHLGQVQADNGEAARNNERDFGIRSDAVETGCGNKDAGDLTAAGCEGQQRLADGDILVQKRCGVGGKDARGRG